MTQTKYIVGAGGGGKGGGGRSTPTEADDTLQSKQFATVVDLISEGEIGGLEDGNKSIFLDDTPVQAADGSNNFEGFTVVTRVGTQGQAHLPGKFGPPSDPESVGASVTNADGTDTGAVAGSVTEAQVEEIANAKMKDLNANDIDAAMQIVLGSARAMGIEVK